MQTVLPRIPRGPVWIDGASDNTAKAVYASLEHLIVEGLFKCIEVWRLPVGHTHEDIDATFGNIAQLLRSFLDLLRMRLVIHL